MPDLPDLIPLDEAQRRVLDGVSALPAEVVDLADAAGLVLAAPVRSALTVPPWTNSAMDGFAVRAADVAGASAGSPVVLRVLGEVPAGRAPRPAVAEGTALRIMTGAMLPAGADAVVPVEDTDAPPGASEIPATVAIHAAGPPGRPRPPRGATSTRARTSCERGRACDPAAIALLAATGHASVDGPPPAAGRGHLHRRRAGPARAAAGTGADPRLQLAHARGPGGRGRRRGPPPGHRPGHARRPARRSSARRSRGPTSSSSPAACRSAPTTT